MPPSPKPPKKNIFAVVTSKGGPASSVVKKTTPTGTNANRGNAGKQYQGTNANRGNSPTAAFNRGVGNFSDGAAERDWATLSGLQARRSPTTSNPNVPASSSGGGGSGGSGGGSGGGLVTAAPVDPGVPFGSIYDALIAKVQGIGNQNLSD